MVIDTSTGSLLLLGGLSNALWDRLRAGTTAEHLLAEVTSRYGDAATASARQFIDELVAAALVVTTDGTPDASPGDAVAWPETFSAPTLERFDEIADIMTMDPIHDVDPGRGWPHAPATG